MIDTKTKLSVEIAGQLVDTLATTHPKITELLQSPALSQSAVAEIIATTKEILFPGFCLPSAGSMATLLADYLRHNIDRLLEQLSAQIEIAFVLDNRFATEGGPAPQKPSVDISGRASQSRAMAAEFVQCLPTLRETLSTDLQAAYDGDPACRNVGEVIFCYPGLQAVLVHRVAHELHKLQVPFLPRMMAEWVHSETGIDIHPGARIGRYFFIDHGTGVVIGQTCVIGDHVKIYQGVTLGALSFVTDGTGALVRDIKRHPTIQDNVVIYANATVLGGRTVIGHDSVIGSSVWITRSVEPFTTIVMEKPRLHLRDATPGDFQPPLDFQI